MGPPVKENSDQEIEIDLDAVTTLCETAVVEGPKIFAQSPDKPGSGSTTDLFPVVYEQLRDLAHAKMNRESSGHTLQTTALVHEVYVRLQKDGQQWQNPGHFFGAAAEAMRRILVERARRVHALKRGGDRQRIDMDFVDHAEEPQAAAMLALDEAITELKTFDARLAEVVMLRYFSGLSVEETAAALETSARTVKRDWAVARAWLARKLGDLEG
jgi:RNA polymerase sigma factor (TIGR02999 family)